MGEEISEKTGHKVLILNGYPDRETNDMTAREYVLAITNALNRYGALANAPHSYVTHIVYVDGSKVEIDGWALGNMGITCVWAAADAASPPDKPQYSESQLVDTLQALCR